MRERVGFEWARLLVVVGQIATVQGIVGQAMTIGIFYTTTVQPLLHWPLWSYLLAIGSGLVGLISFVLLIGIKGYYEFFNKQSALERVEKRLESIEGELIALRKDLKTSQSP